MFQCFVQAAVFTRLDCTKHSWSFSLVFWITLKLIMRGKNLVLVKWEITETMCLMTSQGKSLPFHMTLYQTPLKTKAPRGQVEMKSTLPLRNVFRKDAHGTLHCSVLITVC